MVLLHLFLIHQSIRAFTWGAAAVSCLFLTVFVIAMQPGGGQPTPTVKHCFTDALAC